MATEIDLAQLTQETIAYYEEKFNKPEFPIPDSIRGRKHLVSQYMRTWKFFDGLLEPERYCEYAELAFISFDEYDDYAEFEPELVEGYEIDRNLKRCIMALIDMELEDLQVEVTKLKRSSKYSSSGVSVKAAKAVADIRKRVVSLIMDNKIQLDNVLETKCQILRWLSVED